MMERRFVRLAIGAGAALLCMAAARPALFASVKGGLWEVTGVPGNPNPVRICMPDPQLLAQFEHRSSACTRVTIRDQASSAELHYTCTGGGFGRSNVSLITARALRIETQGISDNAPFFYVLQARRVGDCATQHARH